MTPSNKKRVIFALVLVAGLFLLRFFGITNYINLAFFTAHKEQIQQFLVHHYGATVLIFMLLNLVVVISTVPITPLFNIIGGYLFGVVPGVMYTNIGVSLGAIISFLIVRYLLADAFKTRYAQAAQAFKTEFEKRGANYLLTMQLFPFTPFALINIMAGLSGISVFTFIGQQRWVFCQGRLSMHLQVES